MLSAEYAMNNPAAMLKVLIAVVVAAGAVIVFTPNFKPRIEVTAKSRPVVKPAAPTPPAAPVTVATPVPASPPVLPAEPPPPPPVVILPRPRINAEPPKTASINYALAANGGTASGGNNAALMIDGNWTNYDGGSGFASTEWNAKPPNSLIVALKDAVKIDVIRFLLWDREENRFYRYKLEVSASATGDDWKMVADRSAEGTQCRSWQLVEIPAQPVKRIRLTGTFNNVNTGFHVVELEAFFGMPARKGSLADSPDF